MFTTNYDFSRVKEVFVQGSKDLKVLSTLALLPLLTKAPIRGIEVIPLKRTRDATVLFLTNATQFITDCEESAAEVFGNTNVLPLNIVPFLSKIVKEPTDLLFILGNLKSFLQDLSTNALTIGLQSILDENTEFVSTLLLRVLWTPLLTALGIESTFINFVNQNPPIEITPGFYLLAKLPLPSHLERYFDLQAEVLKPLVTLESPLFTLYLKDDKWLVEKLMHDNAPKDPLRAHQYIESMNITDLIITIRANEVENAFIEEASHNTCINPSPKKGE